VETPRLNSWQTNQPWKSSALCRDRRKTRRAYIVGVGRLLRLGLNALQIFKMAVSLEHPSDLIADIAQALSEASLHSLRENSPRTDCGL
jgi:hypothetical protein